MQTRTRTRTRKLTFSCCRTQVTIIKHFLGLEIEVMADMGDRDPRHGSYKSETWECWSLYPNNDSNNPISPRVTSDMQGVDHFRFDSACKQSSNRFQWIEANAVASNTRIQLRLNSNRFGLWQMISFITGWWGKESDLPPNDGLRLVEYCSNMGSYIKGGRVFSKSGVGEVQVRAVLFILLFASAIQLSCQNGRPGTEVEQNPT